MHETLDFLSLCNQRLNLPWKQLECEIFLLRCSKEKSNVFTSSDGWAVHSPWPPGEDFVPVTQQPVIPIRITYKQLVFIFLVCVRTVALFFCFIVSLCPRPFSHLFNWFLVLFFICSPPPSVVSYPFLPPVFQWEVLSIKCVIVVFVHVLLSGDGWHLPVVAAVGGILADVVYSSINSSAHSTTSARWVASTLLITKHWKEWQMISW